MACDQVDREGLDARYLAGRLSESEAEAFEAHYFECDRCWALVNRGAEVRAAGRPALNAATRQPIRWRRWAWIPLAAAAAAIVWVGSRRIIDPTRPGVDTTTRGGTRGTLSLQVSSSPSEIGAVWPKATGAMTYRVRLFDPSSALLWERRINDTTVSVPRDSLGAGRPGGAPRLVYLQVQALDLGGAALMQSGLVEVPLGPAR